MEMASLGSQWQPCHCEEPDSATKQSHACGTDIELVQPVIGVQLERYSLTGPC